LTCLTQNFGVEIKGKRKFLTPVKPRFKIQNLTINLDVLDEHYQKRWRLRVGMLLYMTKYSCPDILNTIRKLWKCMDSAPWGTYNELFRVIKFIIDTNTFGLKVKINLTIILAEIWRFLWQRLDSWSWNNIGCNGLHHLLVGRNDLSFQKEWPYQALRLKKLLFPEILRRSSLIIIFVWSLY
jgi:hypothetical protein